MGRVFHEFFAGGGMVRAGLGTGWQCEFANDFDAKKAAAYQQNWGTAELIIEDVGRLRPEDVKGSPHLTWASFPCQDLSLAGGGAGLAGKRSGTFWPFWDLMSRLHEGGRASKLVALENVCGTISSHEGRDFSAICDALGKHGYRMGAIVLDARSFVPQSRPRLFVVGVHHSVTIPPELMSTEAVTHLHTPTLRRAVEKLPDDVRSKWIWWRLPEPSRTVTPFIELIEHDPQDVIWHTHDQTCSLLRMMSARSLRKVRAARHVGSAVVGTVYKRMRLNKRGEKVQRAEIRFDEVAGCLRTPSGGSSRQLLLFVDGNNIRSRLISAREAARLMGLPDTYVLPTSYNDAYHLIGDGVAVPVVRYLSEQLFEKVLCRV